VVDGKPVRWSWDFGSPFMVFDRIPAGRDSAWLMPAIIASVGVLALTFFYWPVVALVRRRYKTKPDISGKALTASRAARAGAGLLLALIVGWGVGVTKLTSSAAAMAGAMDGVLMLLQGLGWIVLPARDADRRLEPVADLDRRPRLGAQAVERADAAGSAGAVLRRG
jgi:hypothetical protein